MFFNWNQSPSKNFKNTNRIIYINNKVFRVQGHIENVGDALLYYWAADPPDYNTSYVGSGLPFPNKEAAYQNKLNQGIVTTLEGHYEFTLKYPNSYYEDLGNILVKPCFHIQVKKKNYSSDIDTFSLGEPIPFRNDIYDKTTCNFYDGKDSLPCQTQEQILRSSGYPDTSHTPDNFWGNTPPN